jgi:diketogulonate reductase-like aldo/keto reductase
LRKLQSSGILIVTDFFFVRTIWRYILGKQYLGNLTIAGNKRDIVEVFKNKEICLFSDGAPQHFKQKKTISFWVQLQIETGVLLDVHFYVCYHGHNVCDAYASHIKLRVLRNIREIGVENFNTTDLINAI